MVFFAPYAVRRHGIHRSRTLGLPRAFRLCCPIAGSFIGRGTFRTDLRVTDPGQESE
jgi:hypothetical protein